MFDIINRWERKFMLIEPSIITRSNRRTLAITITSGGEVVVKAPNRLPMSEINKFVLDKQDWIQSKLEKISKNVVNNNDIIKYEKLLLFGEKYMGYRTDSLKKVTFDTDRFLIPTKIKDDQLIHKIKLWYKKYAEDVLGERISYIQQKLHIKAKNFKITDTRGRWGACNNKAEIFLNWRVVMLPPNLIDYVLVHELVHVLEMNHSKKFWETVGKILPNYLTFRKDIKQYSFLLKLY